jgi:hypothetical protein
MTRLHAGLVAVFLGVAASTAGAVSTAPAAPAPTATTAAPGPAPAAATQLDTITVEGVVPGPGLWRVERDGHVLWVLATVSPLPERIEWNADEVAAHLDDAGVLLLAPGAKLEAGGARFGGIFLLPSLLRARDNPDDARLADLLPPADFARWQGLKARYLGRDRGVEKRRPILAAMALRDAAFDAHDLSTRDTVGRTVERAARRAGVPRQRPMVTLVIDDAKGTLKAFARSTLDDLPCFRRTLEQVERDLPTLAERANAWALGDLDALQALPYTDNAQACIDALLGSGLARERGLAALPERIAAAWLADAERALATHRTSVALLPLSRVTGPGSWLDRLAAKGYAVHAPGTGPRR